MADKVDIFMPWYVADYLADTTDLSTEEHGAYMLLLMTSWRSEGILPNDPRRLARIAKVSFDRWPEIWDAISRFFSVTEASVIQGRLLEELEKARSRKTAAAENGAKGAASRWRKNGVAMDSPAAESVADGMADLSLENDSSPSESTPTPSGGAGVTVVPIRGTDGTLTVADLMRMFGETRQAGIGGHVFQAHGLGLSVEKVREAAEIIAATKGAAPFARRSMERFWAQVKGGEIEKSRDLSKSAGLAFAYWIRRFIPGDFEEMTGSAPEVKKPAAAKQKPAYLREMPE